MEIHDQTRINSHKIRKTTTKEPKNISKTTPKIVYDPSVTSTPRYHVNSNLNSLWVYRPNSYDSNLRDEFGTRRALITIPHSLTKLAKTLSLDFNPYFNKGYFEPFEWRPRPVTLVALRKNGHVPRRTIKVEEKISTDVAELQSPYNDVSKFWQDEPGESQK
ncbi:uncharacterized protein LOC119188350 isoform X1 [Manduca sexta]|uniref:uncharacterized protein LOC115441175 isoform X2 n=1 Tax=Manduca sexta TaxID=7130 RepID=UPI00188E8B8A|nr:uncharacterized protein LOC115441175 isoform X2 [Manduca sexta]XP_037300063.1 uncharacterized protein LOC115441175 isoform X2 [Manduca sexta]XP_037301520.1 uncharacterized protein LOC119188350 isoform X1 [Manduca sexta]XP_037301521.1 uncharacterized protein LOC119188350 isoform X1 [Manduca sexta]